MIVEQLQDYYIRLNSKEFSEEILQQEFQKIENTLIKEIIGYLFIKENNKYSILIKIEKEIINLRQEEVKDVIFFFIKNEIHFPIKKILEINKFAEILAQLYKEQKISYETICKHIRIDFDLKTKDLIIFFTI